MTRQLKFLLIGKSPDDRFIIAQALLRDFPRAVLQECQDTEAASQEIRSAPPTAILVHTAMDMNGIEAVQQLRAIDATLLIIYLSRAQQEAAAAMAAGANRFLHSDQWLMAGMLVKELLGKSTSSVR